LFSLNLSGNYTAGKGFFEQFKPDEEVGDYFPLHANADDEGSVIRRRWLDNDYYVLVYSLNYKKEDLNLTLGGGYTKYDGDHFGEVIWDSFSTSIDTGSEYYRSIGEKEEFNTYIKAEYELTESIYTFVDLQYRRVDYSSNGISSDLLKIDVSEKYNFFNPKLGLTYTFDNKNSIYGSYAVANREPNRDDLTKNPIKPKPEQLHDFEFGYKFKSNNLYFITNLYYMNYKDQLVLTGEIDDVGDPIRQNVSKSHRAGIEIQAGYRFSKKLKIDVNTTLSENKIDHFDYIIYDTQYDEMTWKEVSKNPIITEFQNTDISFSPSLIAGSTITYNPKENIMIAFISKYVGKQYLDNTSSNFKSLDAYFVNNLNASIKFKPHWIEEVSLNVLVNNLFDELYSSNGYTYSYYYRPEGSNDPAITEKFFYPQATRNFLAGVTLKF
jgi:iron complex outermembrane receptor protein